MRSVQVRSKEETEIVEMKGEKEAYTSNLLKS